MLIPIAVEASPYALDGVLEWLQILVTGVPENGRIGLMVIVP
jgi:hypothetical protein